MADLMRDYLKILSVGIVCLLTGAFLYRCQSASPGDMQGRADGVTDTVKVYDTIPYVAPVPLTEVAMGTRCYAFPLDKFKSGVSVMVERVDGDTLTEVRGLNKKMESGDSAVVEVPIIQRHYADSTYEAWVSGPIDPRLDSVKVFAPTTIITKREWKPPKRWHLGATIGVCYTPQGFQPFLGVGITYSIISF